MLGLLLIPLFVVACVAATKGDRRWAAVGYFVLTGTFVVAAAFAAVNFVLATRSRGEAGGWFQLFGNLATALSFVSLLAILTWRWFHTPRLATERHFTLSFLLFLAATGWFVFAAQHPSLNWW